MIEIESLIRRRRNQILIHSCIYYRLSSSIVPDHVYDGWARELAVLQAEYPEIADRVVYAEEFKGFTAETVSGFDLPIHAPNIVGKAHYILDLHRKFSK